MSQATDILDYIDRNGSITDDEARDVFGCHRLSARIHDLRSIGINITTEKLKGVSRHGKPFTCARYRRG